MVIDIPDKFWKEWSKADYFDQRDKLKFIVESIEGYYKAIEDKQLRMYAISNLLHGYFEDCCHAFKG